MEGHRRDKWVSRLAMIALTLAVFFLYARCLDRQSLWFDEGLSVEFASRPLGELIDTLALEDLHPPLYYLILHFWMALAGKSELAVRLPSALAVCLMVPLTFAVVREIERGTAARSGTGNENGGSTSWVAAAWAAAALVGTSPFIAYYAQETRMYGLEALLSLAATWAYLVALRSVKDCPAGVQRFRWAAFSILLAASLYTQYFAVLIVPAFLVYSLFLERRQLGRTLSYLSLAALFYVPWIWPASGQIGRLMGAPDYWVTTRIDWRGFLHAIWIALFPSAAAGVGRYARVLALLGAVAFVLLALRLVRSASAQSKVGHGHRMPEATRRWALVLLTFLSPLVLIFLVVRAAPKFTTRYAITAAAPLYISAVVALHYLIGWRARRSQILFALVVLLVVGLSLGPTVAITEGRRDARDDTRGLARFLTANVRSDDALLLMENAPYALLYYYRGAAPWAGMHVGTEFTGAANALNALLQTRPRRVWLVLWHYEFADPSDMVVTELLRIGREVSLDEEFLGYRLRAFDIESHDELVQGVPAPETRTDVGLPSGASLLGFDRFAPDAGRLSYVFYWRADQPLHSNLSCTLSLEDLEGVEYLRLDQALSTPYFLPPSWPVAVPIRGRVDVPLQADLPAQTYRVILRVFDPELGRSVDWLDESGQPLGHSLLLEEMALSKPVMTAAQTVPPQPAELLLGSGLQLEGFGLQTTRFNAGDAMLLTLWWQAPQSLTEDIPVRFSLRDTAGNETWAKELPVLSRYAVSLWNPGETNRSVYRLLIPSTLLGGEYGLWVGAGSKLTQLTKLNVAVREHSYIVPDIQHETRVEFEQGIILLGYDLALSTIRPGARMTITLYWQGERAIAASYKVSVQVLAAGAQLIVQDDAVPSEWSYPTTAWLPGEVVRDQHELRIPLQVPPGDGTLIVALYDELTARRLSTLQNPAADHAVLAEIRIVP
jgi:uncharacterized membrane protein